MNEKPILFNSEMVRAVLNGTKTQTRRVVKPQPEHCYGEWKFKDSAPMTPKEADAGIWNKHCPYGQVGDQLWVRETWGVGNEASLPMKHKLPICSYIFDGIIDPYEILFKATKKIDGDYPMHWRPSIHMPRWASRIQLEITGVRVERVTRITQADAKAEGVSSPNAPGAEYILFRRLWDRINGKPRKDGSDISWAANPWVWVVEFKQIENNACNKSGQAIQS